MRKSKSSGRPVYPGQAEAENEKRRACYASGRRRPDMEPDFIGGRPCPNYDKFCGVDPSAVLAWLNID